MNEQPKQSLPIVVKASVKMWECLAADWLQQRHQWREVAEDAYWYAYEVLPPAGEYGSHFLMAEAYAFTDAGDPILACFAKLNGRYFAKYVESKKFIDEVTRLASAFVGVPLEAQLPNGQMIVFRPIGEGQWQAVRADTLADAIFNDAEQAEYETIMSTRGLTWRNEICFARAAMAA